MGWVWAQRSRLYLAGVVFLMLATVGFGLGHIAPFWLRQDAVLTLSVPALDIGIWFQCQDGGGCLNHDFASDAEYMKATRILQVLGFVGLVVAVAVAIYANCRRRYVGRSFSLEVITGLSGLLGFSGAMVYLGYSRQVVGNLDYLRYNWAFALNVAAAALAMLAAVIIFIANLFDPHRSDDDDDDKADESPIQWQDVEDLRTDGRPLVNGVPAMSGDYYRYGGYDNGAFVTSPNDRRTLPQQPPRDYYNDPAELYPVNPYTAPDVTIVAAHRNVPRPKSSGSDAGARKGQAGGAGHASSRSWQEGMEVVVAETPSRRRRYDERRIYGTRLEPAPLPGLYDHAGPVYPGPVYSRSSPALVELTPFMLPRVVVRGHYEPGYGYPEYVML